MGHHEGWAAVQCSDGRKVKLLLCIVSVVILLKNKETNEQVNLSNHNE